MGRQNRRPRHESADAAGEKTAPSSRTPGVYQDKHGQWWASIGSGKNRHTVRCPQAENTEAKAKAIRRELEKQRDAEIDVKEGRQLLTAFATDWINDKIKRGRTPKTIRFYRQMLELYVLPALGHLRLDQIKPRDIDRLIDDLRGDLAPRSLRHVFDVGSRVLADAERRGYILRNPFSRVDPPEVNAVEQQALDDDQVAALHDAVRGHRLESLYLLTILYGFREGEVLGLRCGDLDVEHRTLTIAQTVQDMDGKVQFGAPKTARSARTLPIPAWALSLLQTRLEALEQERGHAERWTEYDLLWPSEVGTPIAPRNLMRHFYAACRRAGVENATFHQLRHTAATRLGSLGAGQSIVAGVLGHTLPGVTGRYTHAQTEALRPWLERAAQALRRLAEGEPEQIIELKPRDRRAG